jgi:tRNA threonylcarbamoyladenosine biosynthesis protein TsaB
MKLLALDTATEGCTVALWLDGEVLERSEPGGQHSERILPMVDELLAEAGLVLTQLDALAFGRGPGSFTGLRIGVGVAQGLAYGADLPVVPVSSLAALAQGQNAARVLAAFDARMQQVYWGAYVRNAQGIVEEQGAEGVFAPQAVPMPEGEGWVGAGSGWDQYHVVLEQRLIGCLTNWNRQCLPHARYVAELGAAALQAGHAFKPEQALPVYIRNDVAIKQGSRPQPRGLTKKG